jgi:hypothetical protein
MADIPYRAAKKAAKRGYTDIHLKEVDHPFGKVHHFLGSVKVLDTPIVSSVKGRAFEVSTVPIVVKSGTYNLLEKSTKKSAKSPTKKRGS